MHQETRANSELQSNTKKLIEPVKDLTVMI
jgi:hypothetical protein